MTTLVPSSSSNNSKNETEQQRHHNQNNSEMMMVMDDPVIEQQSPIHHQNVSSSEKEGDKDEKPLAKDETAATTDFFTGTNPHQTDDDDNNNNNNNASTTTSDPNNNNSAANNTNTLSQEQQFTLKSFQDRLEAAADKLANSTLSDDNEARRDAAAIGKEALEIEKSGDADLATRILQIGIDVFTVDPPVRATYYNNLACVEKRNGNPEEALLHLESAIECEGGEDLCPPSTLLNVSAAVLSLGYFAAAVRVAQQALRRITRETDKNHNAAVRKIEAEEARIKERAEMEQKKIDDEYVRQELERERARVDRMFSKNVQLGFTDLFNASAKLALSSKKRKEEKVWQEKMDIFEREREERRKEEEKMQKENSSKNNNGNNIVSASSTVLFPPAAPTTTLTREEVDEISASTFATVVEELEKKEDEIRFEFEEQEDKFGGAIEHTEKTERKQLKKDLIAAAKGPPKPSPYSPWLGLTGPQLLMVAHAKFNLGISLREMGDKVKGRHELEDAQDIFMSSENEGKFPDDDNDENQQPQQQRSPTSIMIQRLKSSIDAALALPYHEGGTSPARIGRDTTTSGGGGGIDDTNDNNNNNTTNAIMMTPKKSSSKFSRIRGIGSSTPATTPQSSSSANNNKKNKPVWDSTTSYGASLGVPSNINLSPAAKKGNALAAAAAASDHHHHNQMVIAHNPNNNNTVGFVEDPSIEMRLAGTFVPLRLVRLSEEVRFRESCRRIALARARLEDMRDFKLLMKRERIFAEEEEERVEIEVEQERLFGVTEYWIEFRTSLIVKTCALGELETDEREKLVQDYEQDCTKKFTAMAQELRFLCVQDTERFALEQQEEDAFAVAERQFAERNSYFQTKAKLAMTQMRALACALSCWAFDNALRGENTVSMLRPDMQSSPIVTLRSLTFGQGKWSKQ